MPKPEPQSAVNVETYANGDTEISVSSTGGTLSLIVSPDGPTITIRDLERHRHLVKAAAGLKANGHFEGWFIEKKGATGAEDTLVWFPARKQRAKK
jgi:hypothetical protein